MKEPLKKRYCPNCGKDISHLRKNSKYCKRTVNPDGSVNCCKDDFHNPGKLINYHKTKSIAKIHIENFEVLHRYHSAGKTKTNAAELEKDGLKMPFYIMRMKIPGTEEYGLY